MLTAYISGNLGRGIWNDGTAFMIEGLDSVVREATSREIAQITSPDAEYEICSVTSTDAISSLLKSATAEANVLFLVLSAINPEFAIHAKLLCAQAADPLLVGDMREAILGKLLSKPLPSEVRIDANKAQEYFRSFTNLASILRDLFDSQDATATLEGAFQDATKGMPSIEVDELRAELIMFRVYPPVVHAIRNLSSNAFNNAIVSALLQLKESSIQPAVAGVLDSIRRSLTPILRKQAPRQRDLDLSATVEPVRFASKRARNVDDLLADDPVLALSRISSFEAKSVVDRHIAGIKKQILSGREDLVEKYLPDLVRFQVDNSEKFQLAKSLSLLTSVALAANQLAIADKLSLYAIRSEGDDPVVYTTRAEVLKYQGLFEASLQAYRDAKLRFPECAYAWNGEADVLKEAGRYEEAVAAYKVVRIRFAEDPVPHNGLVSTLRQMGRLADATKEAWKNLKKFHDNSAIRTELGHVLSARGRYKEAAMQYRKVIDSDPKQIHAVLAYVRTLNYLGERAKALNLIERYARGDSGPLLLNAVATQLRIMGRLDLALQKAKAIIAAYPGYSPAKFTLATVLLLSGDAASAIKELPKRDLQSESDWYGYRIYLTCMLAGNSEEAVIRLEKARDNCVWQNQKLKIETVLAVAYSRSAKPKEALKILDAASSLSDDHHKQTRFALLGALNAQFRRQEISETILTRILRTNDPTLIKFKTSVLTHRVSKDDFLPMLLAA